MKFKNKIIIFLFVLLNVTISFAQNDMSVLYNQHFNQRSAKYIPSKLGLDYTDIYLNLPFTPGVYAYANNSIFGSKAFMVPTESRIDKGVDRIKKYGILGAGAEIDYLSFAYKWKKDSSEFMNFSFDVGTKVGVNVLLSGNLLNLAWNGNRQFVGDAIELGPIAVNANANTRYTLGWSMPIPKLSFIPENIKLRAGARLKYITSHLGLYMPKTNATFYTSHDGRSLEIRDLDYQINYTQFDEDNILKVIGKGYGVDLSLAADINDNFSTSVSVLDIGRVKYKENTYSYGFSGDFKFEGVGISNIFSAPKINPDSAIVGDLKGVADTGNVFKMPLASKLIIQGEYIIKNKTKDKEREYNEKSIFVTYIQGFNNMPGGTVKPYFSAGYVHSFNYVFNAGTTINYGGYGRLGMGLITSVRVGPWRLGIGSSNAFSFLIAREGASGLDASLNANWAF